MMDANKKIRRLTIMCPCCDQILVAQLRPSVAKDDQLLWWVPTCRAKETETFIVSRGYEEEEFQKLWDSQKHLWLEA